MAVFGIMIFTAFDNNNDNDDNNYNSKGVNLAYCVVKILNVQNWHFIHPNPSIAHLNCPSVDGDEISWPGWIYVIGKQSGDQKKNLAICLWVMWVPLPTIMLYVLTTCGIKFEISMSMIWHETLATCYISRG